MSRYAPSRRSSRTSLADTHRSDYRRTENRRLRRLCHEQLEDRRMLTFAYTGFGDATGLNLIGDAAIVNGNTLRLTPAATGMEGAAWYNLDRPFVFDSWETTFEFNLNENYGDIGGSDGFTFAIQNTDPHFLSGGGGTLGYHNLPNSLVVEFDTFRNSEADDPSASHISVHTNGLEANNWDESLSIGSYDTPSIIDDATTHKARISYTPGTLQVFFDNMSTPVITANIDLTSTLNLDAGRAWVGFTGTTGGGYQNHDILNWEFREFVASSIITIESAREAEGAADDLTTFSFAVNRDGNTDGTATVQWATADRTAQADDDYVPSSGVLTFGPGETEKVIEITIIGDDIAEGREDFLVHLTSINGAYLANRDALGIILGDEGLLYRDFSDPTGLTFVDAATISPDSALRVMPELPRTNGEAWLTEQQYVGVDFETAFDFRLTPPSALMFVIQNAELDTTTDQHMWGGNSLLLEIDDTRTAWVEDPTEQHISIHTGAPYGEPLVHQDYSIGWADTSHLHLADGAVHTAKITYDAGATRLSVFVDDLANPLFSVSVDLANALDLNVGRAWLGFSAGTWDRPTNHDVLNWEYVTLVNTATTIGVNNVTQREGSGGTDTDFIFTATRLGDLTSTLELDWTATNGSAVAGSDYDTAPQLLVFDPGVSEKTFSVTVSGDDTSELEESFFVNLTLNSGFATLVDARATGIIQNDDAEVVINDTVAVEGGIAGQFIDHFAGTGADWGSASDVMFGTDATEDDVPDLYLTWNNVVTRFDGQTGAWIDHFVPVGTGDITAPQYLAINPHDGNLYVSNYARNNIIGYDGITGTPLGEFVTAESGLLNAPIGMVFGPDGNLYVTSRTDSTNTQVWKFDGETGADLGVFIPTGNGLDDPGGIVFGPGGDLFISEWSSNSVLRFGSDGTPKGYFVEPGSGGLDSPRDLLFGVDGHLYVSESSHDAVLRFNGQTGAFMGQFVASGNGGLTTPYGIAFDDDGLLYVSSSDFYGVLRYGVTAQAVFTVSLAAPVAVPVTISFTTEDGSANELTDYEPSAGNITFAPGETSKVIIIPTVKDTLAENTESFTVTLHDTSGNVHFSDATGKATILDPVEHPSGDVPQQLVDARNQGRPGVTRSTLQINDSGRIEDLNVHVDLSHSYDGQLTATLVAPGGPSVRLFSNVGGSRDNFTATVLDDSAATPITSGSAPFTGYFQPEESLSAFNSLDMAGTWTLEIVDTAKGDSGTLNSWSLEIAASTSEPNDPPTAMDDSSITDEDVAVSIDVLANDSDSDPLTIDSVTQGTNGAVDINGSNVIYTPNDNFYGNDSFTYTISDGREGTDTATVNVVIAPVDDAPDAVDDFFAATENELLSVAANGVLENDSDADGDILSVALPLEQTTDEGGNVTLNSDGSFTYTPPTGFTGVDKFNYTVTDGTLTDSGTVSIDVSPVSTSTAIYVYDIRFEMKRTGTYRAVFEIHADTNRNGSGDDSGVAGLVITAEFAGQTFTGTTDEHGIFTTGWVRKLSSGTEYPADVVAFDLVMTNYYWDTFLDLGDEDEDDDGLPDNILIF